MADNDPDFEPSDDEGGPQKKKQKTSTVSSAEKGPSTIRKPPIFKEDDDDDDIPKGAVKAIADLIEEGVKTKTNKYRKTKDEMEQEYHEAQVKVMRAEASYYSTSEKMMTLVGHGVTSFLSTFDDFLRHMKGKSMVVGGLAFQFEGTEKGGRGQIESGADKRK